jgi:hypothetical protein
MQSSVIVIELRRVTGTLRNDSQNSKLKASRDLIEWMPFLQAYAVSGDAVRLAELAPVIGADPYIAGQACQILDAMPSLSSPVKEVVTAHYCVGQ